MASASIDVVDTRFGLSYLSTDEVVSESLINYLTEVAGKFVLSISVAKEVMSLGETQWYREVLSAVKYWASELVLHMSTGKYVSGLASELSELIRRRPLSNDFSMDELIDFLADVIALWIKYVSGNDTCEDCSTVLSNLTKTFNIDLKYSRILRSIRESCDTGLLVQACLLAILISVGGVGNAYSIEN